MSDWGKNRPRDYIKSSDLKAGDKIEFVDGGQWVKRDFSKLQDDTDIKTVFVSQVKLNGQEAKELMINATSGQMLAEKWGAEGVGWAGRVAKVSFVKANCFGKIKDVLCLVPTDEKAEW